MAVLGCVCSMWACGFTFFLPALPGIFLFIVYLIQEIVTFKWGSQRRKLAQCANKTTRNADLKVGGVVQLSPFF